jgi:hypothetical protein
MSAEGDWFARMVASDAIGSSWDRLDYRINGLYRMLIGLQTPMNVGPVEIRDARNEESASIDINCLYDNKGW